MNKIWCGIPVYNNAATIADVVARAKQHVENIVVVDDGSTDTDLRYLLQGHGATVVRHESNRGKGAALLTAFRHAEANGGQYMITLDGDGQHFPEDIPLFLPQLSPGVILLGRRDEVTGEMPRSSRFGRRFSDFWIYVETGTKVSDSQSGFRAYPLRHLLALDMWSRHYNFEMEILTRAIWAGFSVKSVPIRVWYPEAEKRVSSFRPVMDNFRISRVHVRLLVRRLLPIPHRQLYIADPT